MLHMLYGKTLRDGISNQNDNHGEDKEFTRAHRLRRFGHVERMDNERTPVKAKNFVVDGSKKGRPKDGKEL